MILVILKLLVVLFFLVMFVRRPTVVWGIGLLTVTTAVLLDTLLGTFNRDELLAELGFFFYVIAGVLLAGAATWFWGVVRPWVAGNQPAGTADMPSPAPASTPATIAVPQPIPAESSPPAPAPKLPPPLPPDHVDQYAAAGYDRQMLYEEIRQRFSREDLSDLMFDLDVNELEVATVGQSMDDLIVRVMDKADLGGNAPTVALAVERILTPPPPEHLPRLEKLSVDSPRTVIRHFLLANYSVEDLQELAAAVNVDWEQLPGNDKKAKTRALLDYLYRRGRLGSLLDAMHAEAEESESK